MSDCDHITLTAQVEVRITQDQANAIFMEKLKTMAESPDRDTGYPGIDNKANAIRDQAAALLHMLTSY